MNKRKRPIVALIYDFDGTLAPGNMQESGFIQSVGRSIPEFWKASNELAERHNASDVLCYMKLMMDEARASGKPITRQMLQDFGKSIPLFDGVDKWFDAINRYGRSKGVIVEHYINSSGMTEMIEGTCIADKFKEIFACSFMYDGNGYAFWPSVAVDYTGKTQFLFKINKGILSITDAVIVNESWADDRKRIPFSNMIYLGDGETDVPCMKIVKMFEGHSIAIYDPSNAGKEATARKLFRQNRVNFMAPADYRTDAPLFNIVTKIIDKIKSDHELVSITPGK